MHKKTNKHKVNFIAGVFFLSSIIFPQKFYAAENNTTAATVSRPEIYAQADKTSILIGETINYTVKIKTPKGLEIKWNTEKNKIGEFDIRDFKQKEILDKDNNRIIILHYKLTTYEFGKLKIPEYVIQYRAAQDSSWNTSQASAMAISVQSMIGNAENAALKPLKPKFGFWQNLLMRFLIGLILGALAILGLIFLQKRKKEKSLGFVRKPAHVLAEEELEGLKRLKLLEKGRFKEYFEILSNCIRHYLENRFNIRAPWMSTEEFLEYAKAATVLNVKQKNLLRDFLLLSDLVKFARYASSLKEAENSFQAAKNFIDQTREVEPEKEKIKT